MQDVRGTYASDGAFEPFRNEREDGADTIEWASSLPGANGSVGMFGLSYQGHTQLAAAVGDSGALKAIIPRQRCADPLNGIYFRQGAFELTMQTIWYALHAGLPQTVRAHEGDATRLNAAVRSLANAVDALSSDGYRYRPLVDFAPLAGTALADHFFAPLRNPMDADALSFLDLTKDMDAISTPALHVGGWYDIFIQQTLDDYVAMQHRGVPVQLFVGPGTHTGVSIDPIGDRVFGVASEDPSIGLSTSFENIQLDWFDRHLKNDPTPPDELTATVFVMGENRWRTFASWPPESVATSLYLDTGGNLVEERPSGGGESYTYDPDDPVPTLGGAIMGDAAHRPGVFDQRPIESRPDVLTFTTAPLLHDLEVIGRVTAHLWAQSDAVDTDFVVRVCDVEPDGRSLNVVDGIVRALYRDHSTGAAPSPISPSTPYEYEIDLWSTAYVFRRGHQIRVQVTSSNFPRWDANPNTGTPFESTTAVVAHQTVLHGPGHPSRLVLPVIR
jgi:putative CocE/NonD family hydrolase